MIRMNVETVDLSGRGVKLPSDRVGMVLAQPCLKLTSSEPYRCEADARQEQLAVLDETLKVARQATHGLPKTHFTVFPEYSIPGLDGVRLIDTRLGAAEWPTGTIVIGGTDGMSKADFTTLASNPNTHLDKEHNSLDRIRTTEWINCCITWIKGANGTVERWLQPKLWPAWLEQDIPYQDMFHGQSVFTFVGPLENGIQYRFFTLVCFDWIAMIANQKAWHWVIDALQQKAAQMQAELSLSWLFVIQCNKKPSHDTFLSEVSAFFNRTTFPAVHRDQTCLVFANTAGKNVPGKADGYGCTSLVLTRGAPFSDPKCHPTFSNGGARFRSSTLLSPYRDVLFRERGACIHAFAQVNPNSVNAGAADRTIAIEKAFVFPLNGTVDPRAPGEAVPACVKWLNDQLDELSILSVPYPAAPLSGEADTVHQQTIATLRAIPAQSADHVLRLASTDSIKEDPANERDRKWKHADEWDRPETEALEHLVHTLDIIRLGFADLQIDTVPAHATVTIRGEFIDLLAIRGDTHEACIDHSKKFSFSPRRQILLISRDRDNTPWAKRFGSFLEPQTPRIGDKIRYSDPQGAKLHLGYAKILNAFRNAATREDLERTIYAELTA